MKKLYLSRDKKFLGVCAGIADYLNVDPTLIRIALVCVSLATVVLPMIVAYVVMALVFPSAPDDYNAVNTSKKLLKSSDKKLAGVCAGIAEYFGIDPTVVRLIFALFTFFIGYGIMTYIVCLIMMPSDTVQIITD